MFDALSTQFSLLSEEEQEILKSEKDHFKRLLKNTIAQDDYLFTSLTSSTGNKNKTHYRHKRIKDLIQDVINDRI